MASRVRVDIDADTSGLRRGVGDAEHQLGRLNGVGRTVMAGMAKAAAAATVAIGVGFAAAVRTGTGELIEQEKASARTANVLKTTGGVANITADQVEKLASSLQRTTGTADDAIQSSENLLLTFTNVRNEVGKGNDVFNRAIPLINDMSVALGTDLNAATIQVGKALNDPIKGITALGRAGVSFTKDQKDQIKTLVDSGRTLDAQKIILKELATEFAGAASSEGKTTESIQKLQRGWEDLSEALAQKLIPVLTTVVDIGSDLIDWFDSLSGKQQKLVLFGTGAVAALAPLAKIVGTISGSLGVLRGAGAAAFGGSALSTIGGRGAPVPVFVTNPGFGTGGVPGVGGAAGGAARAGATVPGIGTLAGGGVGLPLIGGAALIGAGLGLNAADKKFGLLGPSEEESRKFVEKSINAQVLAWRRGRTALQAEIAKTTILPADAVTAKMADAAEAGIESFRKAVTAGGKNAKHSAEEVTAAALQGLDGLKPGAQKLAADSMIRMAKSLETNGRVPRGTTARLVSALEQEIGKLPDATRTAAFGMANAFGPVFATIRQLNAAIAGVVAAARSAGSAGGRSFTPGESRNVRLRLQELGSRTISGGNPLSRSGVAALAIAATHRGDSLEDKQARAAAEAAAAGSGVTNPDRIAAEGDAAVLRTRRADLAADAAAVQRAADAVKRDIAAGNNRLQKLYAQLRKATGKKNADRRTKLKDAIADQRAAVRDLYDELRALIDQGADIAADAAEIDYDLGQIVTKIASLPTAAPSSSDASDGTSAGPGPDAQALIDQANARATAAEQNAAGFGAFIETLRRSGSIDPGLGSVTVIQNIDGNLVQESSAASWITAALRSQGAPGPGFVRSTA